MKTLPLTNGGCTTVSDCDYSYLRRWSWTRRPDNYVARYLGLFPDTKVGKKAAARAYNKAALEYFGEFAVLNKVLMLMADYIDMKTPLTKAKVDIDAAFGVGYAKANPALVGAYLQAAALREIDATLVEAIENVVEISGKFHLFRRHL